MTSIPKSVPATATQLVVVRESCRLCGSRALDAALELVPTPVGDDFVTRDALDRPQPPIPLSLMLCGDCGHVQLRHVVDAMQIYGEYLYTTSVSRGLADHFIAHAEGVISRLGLSSDAFIVEMGSNEGAMLSAFQRHGMTVLGIDPARRIAEAATGSGIETLPVVFTPSLAREIRADRGGAHVVIANNVFANIDDVGAVMEGVRTLLRPDGVFLFETSYFLDVFEHLLLDTVFHEHYSYFSVGPMSRFFRANGFELIDVERVSTKGGSLRGTVQLAGGARRPAPAVANLQRRELEAGIATREGFKRMAARCARLRDDMNSAVGPFLAPGKSVAGYGASVGITTLIYFFDLGGRLSFIVDDNPLKQQRFSPGHHLPVYATDALYSRKPDAVIAFPWRYVDAIMKGHQRYLEQGGRFIMPLPTVKVIAGPDPRGSA